MDVPEDAIVHAKTIHGPTGVDDLRGRITVETDSGTVKIESKD
jgi:hypothetical protein